MYTKYLLLWVKCHELAPRAGIWCSITVIIIDKAAGTWCSISELSLLLFIQQLQSGAKHYSNSHMNSIKIINSLTESLKINGLMFRISNVQYWYMTMSPALKVPCHNSKKVAGNGHSLLKLMNQLRVVPFTGHRLKSHCTH